MTDPKSKLNEILKRVVIGYGGYDDSILDHQGMSLDEARLALIKLMESLVPEEKEVKQYHPQWECDLVHLTHKAKAWNDARQTMLDRIKELK